MTPARLEVVDALRGVAILGVVVYHFFWDLSYFWLIEADVSTQFAWVAFARTLLGTFVGLVGVSLVLAHRAGIAWPPFWRRLAMIGGAALLVSVGTYIFFPETFVYFGVLHAIALFSVLGLAFLNAPLWLVFAAGLAVFLAPFAYSDTLFEAKPLSWIGFWPVPPPTNDLVPVFPWFGVTLIGMGLTRVALARGWDARLARWRADGPAGRLLVWAGRWSLVIYLVHQPVLLAGVYPFAQIVMPETASRNAFVRTCEAGCVNTGSGRPWCEAYCGCALDAVEADDLWAAVEAPDPTPEQSRAVSDLVLQCTFETSEDLLPPLEE